MKKAGSKRLAGMAGKKGWLMEVGYACAFHVLIS
jgi:hypothetical protein